MDCSEFGENGFAELGPNYAAAAERRDSSRWQNIVSGSAFAVGAVAVVTGAVLVYLNQPKAVTLEQEANAVSLTPWLGPENAGVMMTLGFSSGPRRFRRLLFIVALWIEKFGWLGKGFVICVFRPPNPNRF